MGNHQVGFNWAPYIECKYFNLRKMICNVVKVISFKSLSNQSQLEKQATDLSVYVAPPTKWSFDRKVILRLISCFCLLEYRLYTSMTIRQLDFNPCSNQDNRCFCCYILMQKAFLMTFQTFQNNEMEILFFICYCFRYFIDILFMKLLLLNLIKS